LIEKEFNADKLYSRIIHYYMDKRGYTREKSNQIAQSVIRKEITRRVGKNPDCGQRFEDHVRNHETCRMLDCDCRHFVKV